MNHDPLPSINVSLIPALGVLHAGEDLDGDSGGLLDTAAPEPARLGALRVPHLTLGVDVGDVEERRPILRREVDALRRRCRRPRRGHCRPQKEEEPHRPHGALV